MDERPPRPWHELFEIFRLARKPGVAASYWLNEAMFSALHPAQPRFEDLLSFILASTPSIDHQHNTLAFQPRMIHFPIMMQHQLLQFLATNMKDIPQEQLEMLNRKCFMYYEQHEDKTLPNSLHLLTHQRQCDKPQIKSESEYMSSHDALGSMDNVDQPYSKKEQLIDVDDDDRKLSASQKRHSDHHIEQMPKKLRISETCEHLYDLQSTDISVMETAQCQSLGMETIKSMFESEDVDEIVSYLQNEKNDIIHNLCLSIFSDNVISDSILYSVCVKVNDLDNNDLLRLFLSSLCVPYMKQMKKPPSRGFQMSISQTCTKHSSLCLQSFLIPTVERLCVLNTFQVQFMINISKKALDAEQKTVFFTAILQNNWESVNNFESIVALFQGFINFKLKLEQEHFQLLCTFFKGRSTIASNSFPFTKLILMFVKTYSGFLNANNTQLLENVIDANVTSLKTACKNALLQARQ